MPGVKKLASPASTLAAQICSAVTVVYALVCSSQPVHVIVDTQEDETLPQLSPAPPPFSHLHVPFRLQALRDTYVPALQRKADSLDADSSHDTQRLEELQADYALLEHELQVRLTPRTVSQALPYAACSTIKKKSGTLLALADRPTKLFAG